MLSVPPCAYCGARLVHMENDWGRKRWHIFWYQEGQKCSMPVESPTQPEVGPGCWVEADGFQCERKCT